MQYDAPGERVASFGLGILTGNTASQGEIVTKLQDNIDFRVNSLQDIITGGSQSQNASPLDRRRQIMQRRQDLVTTVFGNVGSIAHGGNSGGGSGGSGQIGNSSGGSSTSSANTVAANVPLLSQVGGTTRQKAESAGYSG